MGQEQQQQRHQEQLLLQEGAILMDCFCLLSSAQEVGRTLFVA